MPSAKLKITAGTIYAYGKRITFHQLSSLGLFFGPKTAFWESNFQRVK